MITKTNNPRKSHRIYVRLTGKEYLKIDNLCKISTCRSKSEFIREVVLKKPITIFYRNQSLDDLIEEIVILNREINTLKDDQYKILPVLYRCKNSSELNQTIQEIGLKLEGLHKKMDEVKNQMEKIVEKWSQL